MEKNSIPTGLLLGALMPIVGYILVDAIFNVLMHFNLMEVVTSSGLSKRLRTITLLAICTNLIPFNIAKNRRWDNTMRGIVFPTLIYVGAWIYKFKDVLF